MEVSEIDKLISEYLETLEDTVESEKEFWATPLNFAKPELESFIAWIKNKET